MAWRDYQILIAFDGYDEGSICSVTPPAEQLWEKWKKSVFLQSGQNLCIFPLGLG